MFVQQTLNVSFVLCLTVPRPFRIPFGTKGCCILLAFPVTATFAVIAVSSLENLAFSLAVNLVGLSLYFCKRSSTIKSVASASSSLFESCRRRYSKLGKGEEEESRNDDGRDHIGLS